jgi:hypothetical protein
VLEQSGSPPVSGSDEMIVKIHALPVYRIAQLPANLGFGERHWPDFQRLSTGDNGQMRLESSLLH